jgi:hypothetical protein
VHDEKVRLFGRPPCFILQSVFSHTAKVLTSARKKIFGKDFFDIISLVVCSLSSVWTLLSLSHSANLGNPVASIDGRINDGAGTDNGTE